MFSSELQIRPFYTPLLLFLLPILKAVCASVYLLLLGLIGEVRVSRPITACTGIDNDVNGTVVLVERYGKDTSCPYEKQAFEVIALQIRNQIIDTEERWDSNDCYG